MLVKQILQFYERGAMKGKHKRASMDWYRLEAQALSRIEEKPKGDPESDNSSSGPLQFEIDFRLAMWFRNWQLTKGDVTEVIDIKHTNLFNSMCRLLTKKMLDDLDLQRAI